MKLQQLRYLIAIVDNGLNITAASQALFTSQPGVSKQVRLLEEELSLQLFTRKGKSLSSLTEAGRDVVARARTILTEVANIKSLSRELAGQKKGKLIVATTHTQARYVLPDLLEGFHRTFPEISISLHQGTSDHIAGQVRDQEADFAIASGHNPLFEELVSFPLYHCTISPVTPSLATHTVLIRTQTRPTHSKLRVFNPTLCLQQKTRM
jgi:LysR family cys regulon transcriptional activator